jgi:hypothetical protein
MPVRTIKQWIVNMEKSAERHLQDPLTMDSLLNMPQSDGEAAVKMKALKREMQARAEMESKESEASARASQQMAEHAWKEVQEMRVMKMVIRAKAPSTKRGKRSDLGSHRNIKDEI